MTLLDLRQPTPCPALADTFRELGEACSLIEVEVGHPGAGTLHASRMAEDPEVLAGVLLAERRRITTTLEADPRDDAVAMWALHGYAWYACLMLAGPWFLRRRVPHVSLDDVWIDTGSDRMRRSFGVSARTFACLPDDPRARASGARVVADEAALRAELLRGVADHLAPLLTVFRPHLRRGEQVLWGMAADELVSGVWYLGRTRGEGERAVRELEALLPGGVGHFKREAGFRTLVGSRGQTHRNRTQSVCCLWYTLNPDALCSTCPRASDDRQVAILEGRE
ncbi:(2Fe-2S)-binding protein [Streptomyces sp. SID3343]|uniref:(2Fe-2S)-binding protein n=1 Tax=Streptomyces sp. SID3343 TaxID=2690260 RepID=UPI00136D7822|nr:(2Fe-2S)-binding protein [Streptomyces sp. SID3343]MYV98233.1 iron-sulfur protein [Streptomyces sp. SID3343]